MGNITGLSKSCPKNKAVNAVVVINIFMCNYLLRYIKDVLMIIYKKINLWGR